MLAYSLMLTSERSIGSVVFVYAILRGCMFMKRQGSTKKDVVYLGRPVPSYMSDRLERKKHNAGGGVRALIGCAQLCAWSTLQLC